MARKTVRVDVPIKEPDKFSKLLKGIWDQHTKLGNNSPLKEFNKVNMTFFNNKRMDADGKRQQAADLHEEAEKINEQAEALYGRAESQNINTSGTLYNSVDLIKDKLLLENEGNEEALSEWEFNVVVGQAKSPTKKNNG